ncbi:hypothetical protein BB934_43885 (plasmid) [Microvirga ossetica]|uniref:Uncharacterized protein n=1 Tax=Microvirga ossetica TaxID=1882682 RepID=A0A1B2EYU1_9HYPH|nr:hypothetical protein BB934_43885 [Microvirga ossetica]
MLGISQVPLRISRKFPQHRLHMFLYGMLIGLEGALLRLRHPTLLGHAAHMTGQDDDGLLKRLLL